MKTLQHERYLFRQMKQNPGESIDSFYRRLRDCIKRCDYSASEEENRLKEQIIDKCTSSKLREIALQISLNLEELIVTGKTLESDSKAKLNETRPFVQRSFSHREERRECSRCGFFDHSSADPKCPALKARCNGCTKNGHYEKMCWEVKYGSVKRARTDSFNENWNKKNCYDNNKFRTNPRDPRNNQNNQNNYNNYNGNGNGYNRNRSPENFNRRTQIKQEPRSPDRWQQMPEKRQLTPDRPGPSNKRQRSPEHRPRTPEYRPKTPEKRELHEKHESISNNDQDDKKPLQELLKIHEANSKLSSETVDGVTYFNCLVGGMPTKLIIDKNYPTNVMSKETFKKLHSGKYKFFTTDFVPSKVGDFQFSGQFTSKIEINNLIQYISFYVKEGSEEFVTIGKKMADQLKLPMPNN